MRSARNSASPGVGLAVVLVLVAAGAVSGSDEVDARAFVDEYRVAAARLKDDYRPIRVEGIVTKIRNVGTSDERTIVVRTAYASDGKAEKVAVASEKPVRYDRVLVVAKDRSFVVYRPTPKGAYAVERIDAKFSSSYQGVVDEPRKLYVDAALAVAGRPFLELVSSPGFEARGASRPTVDGESLVQLDFASALGEDGSIQGWVRFDPRARLAVRSYEVTWTRGPNPSASRRIRGSSSYSADPDGVPLPREVAYSFRVGEGPEQRYQFTAEHCSTAEVPPGEFTLAAYGLGDVDDPPGELADRTGYWIFGIAAASLVMSVVIRRWGV